MPLPKIFFTFTIASPFLFAPVLLTGDTSSADLIDTRQVIQTEVDASIDDVWSSFTTTSGLQRWCAPLIEIDFKVGGKMRSNYDSQGELGDANTIENTILCFDPKRMLSLKATKAPEGFPFPNAIKDVWTVMYFEEISPSKTKITTVGLGYTDTEESQQMQEFFAAANNYELDKLKASFKQPVME